MLLTARPGPAVLPALQVPRQVGHHLGRPVRTGLRTGAVDAAGDRRVSLRAGLHPHHRLPSDVRPLPRTYCLSQVSQIPDNHNFPHQKYEKKLSRMRK